MRSFSGRTIIVITHNLENLHWADYVIMIESGTIREVGSPAELLNRESAVRLLKEGPHASARSRESTLAVA